MSITYTRHPQFEFNILVDLYANDSTLLPLSITKVERKLLGEECVATVRGYVEVDVPIDVCSVRLVDSDEHLSEVVREAQRRSITSVKTRCVFSVMLDGRAYRAVELDNRINMSRYFDVEMMNYVIDSQQVVENLITTFDDELQLYVTYYITQFMNKSYANRANLMITRKRI